MDPSDDAYTPCFGGCDTATISDNFKTNFDQYGNFYPYGYDDYGISIERQTGESFTSTKQSRRVLCRTTSAGERSCRLRVDRLLLFLSNLSKRLTHTFRDRIYTSSSNYIHA